MSVQTFSDRFIYANPALTKEYIDTLVTEADFNQAIPQFKEYVTQVKSYSILLSGPKVTYRNIYDVATQDSDPRISLILASAKTLNNTPMFPSMEVVKEIMFGPSNNLNIFDKDEYNIFVEGVKRVSTVLTAAKLIGQLSQIDEQFKHYVALEKQALADMDRLIKLNSIKDLSAVNSSSGDPTYAASLYFEIKEFTLLASEQISCEVFVPSIQYNPLPDSNVISSLTTALTPASNWVTVANLTNGTFNTGDLCAIIADAINSITLNNHISNILAAPMLSNSSNRHELKFDARLRSATLAAELVSIRFKCLDSNNNPTTIPFKWGANSLLINYSKVNSVLLAVQNGKVATTASALQIANSIYTPTVLYIKRGPLDSLNRPLDLNNNVIDINKLQNSRLTIRVSTRGDNTSTVAVQYKLDDTNVVNQLSLDKNRPAQVADLIIEELFKIKSDTRTLGTLFRSDDSTPDPISAIELICFTATNPETWSILDILELPPDILIATGNLNTVITPFSNNPRAIRIDNKFVSSKILSGNVKPTSGESSAVSVMSCRTKNSRLDQIKDRVSSHRFL